MTDRAVSQVPDLWGMALFEAKATAFRLRRSALEVLRRSVVARHGRADTLTEAPIIARVSSPLWPPLQGEKDRALTAGKIHNLRRALRHIDGIEVPAGSLFSFWRQIGRTTRARGFVKGRELREGCLIANVGGGLCQLSNALYEAALAAGFEIAERHAHSHLVPGSRAAAGRDATVFWNYVDLRFSSAKSFRIEAALRHGALEITFRGGAAPILAKDSDLRVEEGQAVNDCTSCGETDCRRHAPEQPLDHDEFGSLRSKLMNVIDPYMLARDSREKPVSTFSQPALVPGQDGPTAWLVDACWPEFSILFAATVREEDALFVPQRLRQSSRHAWPQHVVAEENCATLIALRRALSLRRAPKQGRALQDILLRYDEALARRYARKLSHLHTHLVISQNLLPHLWRLGELQGRTFDVLMVRHPMVELQAKLDAARTHYPMSPTLGDFRAPEGIVEAESKALAEARTLLTPHSGIAACHPTRTCHLDWIMPAARGRIARGGKSILFPASALARKGAYALRDAVKGLDIDIIVASRAREQDGDFWGNVRARPMEGPDWPSEIAAVVLPAVIEHEPRALLKAIAHGLPVIATEECGLGDIDGLTTVPAYDPEALRHTLMANTTGRFA